MTTKRQGQANILLAPWLKCPPVKDDVPTTPSWRIAAMTERRQQAIRHLQTTLTHCKISQTHFCTTTGIPRKTLTNFFRGTSRYEDYELTRCYREAFLHFGPRMPHILENYVRLMLDLPLRT